MLTKTQGVAPVAGPAMVRPVRSVSTASPGSTPEIAVGITTAPRRRPTLAESLASYRSELSVAPHVFAEPGAVVELRETGGRVHWNTERLGCAANWLRGLRHLVATGSPWILMCQDDIVWRLGSGVAIAEGIALYEAGCFPRLGLLSPYCSMVNARNLRVGWHEARYRDDVGWCGALALLLPRRSAIDLLDHPDLCERSTDRYLDYAIGRSLRAMDRSLVAHMPSLVHHIGRSSTLLPARRTIPNRILLARTPYDTTRLRFPASLFARLPSVLRWWQGQRASRHHRARRDSAMPNPTSIVARKDKAMSNSQGRQVMYYVAAALWALGLLGAFVPAINDLFSIAGMGAAFWLTSLGGLILVLGLGGRAASDPPPDDTVGPGTIIDNGGEDQDDAMGDDEMNADDTVGLPG